MRHHATTSRNDITQENRKAIMMTPPTIVPAPRTRVRAARSSLVVLVALLLVLAGCGNGGSGGGTDANGKVTLRFSWWGDQVRAAATEKAIKAFEAANPKIVVKGEYAEFDAYFDRIATSVAAGKGPDVITMGGAYPREYGDRGALLDLSRVKQELDLSKIDEAALGNGKFSGKQYGVPTGVNTYGVVINPAIFKAAGVALPDEDTWTWDDFARIAAEVSDKAPKGTYGAEDPTAADSLDLFSRQQGESLYTKDGGLAITDQTLTNWWTMTKSMRDSGATPSASLTEELASQASPEQTLMGRGRAAMKVGWSNQLTAFRAASGKPLELFRAPGESAGQPGQWLQASQLYTINGRSKHPAEAAKLVNFLVNSPVAGKIILTDRGIPSNPDVLRGITPVLTEDQKDESAYLERITKEAGPPLIIGPTGSTDTPGILTRLNAEVLFNRQSPAEAAKKFVDEVKAAIA
jgi:multiple sugar transport system substrate-binding protein